MPFHNCNFSSQPTPSKLTTTNCGARAPAGSLVTTNPLGWTLTTSPAGCGYCGRAALPGAAPPGTAAVLIVVCVLTGASLEVGAAPDVVTGALDVAAGSLTVALLE